MSIRIDNEAPLVLTVPELLAPDECADIVTRATALGFEAASIAYPDGARMNTDVRNSDRVELEDELLRAMLWARVSEHLPLIAGARATHLNDRMRVYRYRPGQRFAMHRDGTVENDAGERSRLTLLVYLDEEAIGGETDFPRPGITIAPKIGLAVLFQHALLHESRPVERGVKHALRTDVFYAR